MDEQKDILAAEKAEIDNYKETDVFTWANNLVQYKDELKVEVFLINKNYIVYKTNMAKELGKQLEPIFIDEILEFVLEGAAEGLIVRGFEEAEAEDKVLQRTQIFKVDKLKETLGWLRTQEHEIELFKEEDHDIKRIKGVLARISHPALDKPFYVAKVLPQSQVMKGSTGWMVRAGKFIPFDADAAVRIPTEPQLLILDQDVYVFNQTKLKQLFGYDAKEASIAEKKIAEILEHFKLSFEEGATMNSLIKDKKAAIKKLQKIDPTAVKQEELVSHSEEVGVPLMTDNDDAIIIMDSKDLNKFVNLLNDDYIESPLTGVRYEIIKKRELKPDEDEMFGEPVI
jgi:hypothetical protein